MRAAGELRLARFLFGHDLFYCTTMASQADSLCFADAPPVAVDVARGVTRLFCRHDLFAVCEVPLPNGRRADLMAIDGKGWLTIVEIKVAKAEVHIHAELGFLMSALKPVIESEITRKLDKEFGTA